MFHILVETGVHLLNYLEEPCSCESARPRRSHAQATRPSCDVRAYDESICTKDLPAAGSLLNRDGDLNITRLLLPLMLPTYLASYLPAPLPPACLSTFSPRRPRPPFGRPCANCLARSRSRSRHLRAAISIDLEARAHRAPPPHPRTRTRTRASAG